VHQNSVSSHHKTIDKALEVSWEELISYYSNAVSTTITITIRTSQNMDIDFTDTASTSHTLVTDLFLRSVLETTQAARLAALNLLEVSAQSASSAASPEAASPTNEEDSASPVPASIAQALAVSRAQKPLFAHLAHLRAQNRRLAHVVRDTKALTSESRAEVDTLHLSLQNLYYESRHLAGEIAACEEYDHPYRRLPLISEEDFLEKQPEWQGKRTSRRQAERTVEDADNTSDKAMEETADAPQAQDDSGEEAFMKARILAEHDERLQLEEQRKKLVARKMELVKENAKRKEELGKLDKELEAFIEAARPIQRTFETVW
jgi:THO complex subunit 5